MLNSFHMCKEIQYADYKNVNLLDNFNVFLCRSNIQISYSQIDIVTYVTSCYRLTPRLTECKHFLLNAQLMVT